MKIFEEKAKVGERQDVSMALRDEVRAALAVAVTASDESVIGCKG